MNTILQIAHPARSLFENCLKRSSMKKVGLFIPCFIDQFYPDVGMATVEVLERFGCEVDYPTAQTCCGQPMANSGCTTDAAPLAERMIEIFAPYEYVVAPSGSCVSMVREHYSDILPASEGLTQLQSKTFELCEFLVDVLKVEQVEGKFPYRVGMHQSCHGLRDLRLAKSSELAAPEFDKVRQLLQSLEGISFSDLDRKDECCGFGGTFAVSEEAVSCMMGRDRLADHERAETEVLTAGDMSCLMHLDGLNKRQDRQVAVMHVSQILAGRQPDKVPPAKTNAITCSVAKAESGDHA